MENAEQPEETPFDRLLGLMPKIADVVNQFDDAEVKRSAFDVLMTEYGVERRPRPTVPAGLRAVEPLADDAGEDSDRRGASELEGKAQASTTRQSRPRKAGSKKSWPIDKQINFRPSGKPSLREFADEKQPKNIDQKNAVIIYYMAEVLGMSTANIGQVLAGYAACPWKPPGTPDVALRTTASKYGWINTSDTKSMTITHGGRAFVEFDLPAQKATSA